MKLKIIVILFLNLGLFQCAFSQQWKLFYSEKGQFNIMTPGLMEEKENTFETSMGSLVITSYILQTPNDSLGNFLYLINFYDLPQETLDQDSLALKNEMLQSAIDQNTQDLNGELLYQNEINIGDHPGYLWRVNYEGGTLKCRAYIVNDRFYMLQVFSRKDKGLNNNIDRFLESFTLLE